MKLLILLFSLFSSVTVSSFACSGARGPELQQNFRFYPIAGDGINHWPAQKSIVIGSIASFLTSAGTSVELRHTHRGQTDPLTMLGEASHEQIRVSPNIIPKWVDLDHDTEKYKWMHIYASSFGTTEVIFRAPNGSTKIITFTMVYPSPVDKPFRQAKEVLLDQDKVPTLFVDGRDNIEVTVSGRVSDGWTATPTSETGFNLIRIHQVDKSERDPQVKLFFAGTNSPKNGTVIVQKGGGFFAKKMEFVIKTVPTTAC